MIKNEWGLKAKKFLKLELKRRDITYVDLAQRLPGETKQTIAGKISWGKFSASFFLAALHAIGVEKIELDDL